MCVCCVIAASFLLFVFLREKLGRQFRWELYLLCGLCVLVAVYIPFQGVSRLGVREGGGGGGGCVWVGGGGGGGGGGARACLCLNIILCVCVHGSGACACVSLYVSLCL